MASMSISLTEKEFKNIICVMKSLIHITTDHKSPIRLCLVMYEERENEEVIAGH